MSVVAAVAPLHAADLPVYAAKSLIVVAVLLAGFRLLGRRETAQLNVYDLAMVMALSNAVQNAMTGGRGNLAIGVVSSSTVVATAWVVTRLTSRRPALERRILGTPTLVVHDGHVLQGRLRHERISTDELAAALREHGLADVHDAAMVVLEVDGSLSVVPRPVRPDDTPSSPGTRRRRRRRRH